MLCIVFFYFYPVFFYCCRAITTKLLLLRGINKVVSYHIVPFTLEWHLLKSRFNMETHVYTELHKTHTRLIRPWAIITLRRQHGFDVFECVEWQVLTVRGAGGEET